MRRIGSISFASLTVAVLLAGCGTAVQDNSMQQAAGDTSTKDLVSIPIGDSKIQDGGTLIMGLSIDPDALDPTTTTSLYSRFIFANTCEKLYDIDSTGNTVPLLATADPEISADGQTYTIQVKQGVKFADGTTLDADSVVTSINRNLTKDDSARKTELGPITSVKALKDDTIQIDLSRPYAPLTSILADRAGMIMSPTALSEEGDDFGNMPVCVGPFKFESRVPSTSITLVKDPNYYDATNVHLDKIEYKIIKDSSIRTQNLKSGDVEVADKLAPQDAISIKDDPNITLMSSANLGYQGMEINIANAHGAGQPTEQIDTPIAKDKRIRQALDMSIDRDEIVESVFGGMYERACSFVPDNSIYASEKSKTCRSYDPSKAKELLKDAGVTTPFSVHVSVDNASTDLQVIQAIQSQVKEGGFDLQIDSMEYTSLLEKDEQGQYGDSAFIGWGGRFDPDGNVRNLFQTDASMNYTGYSNTKVDELLDDATIENDTAKRADLYGQVAEQMREDTPYIYIYRERNLTGVSNKAVGIDVYSDGVVRLAHAALVAE